MAETKKTTRKKTDKKTTSKAETKAPQTGKETAEQMKLKMVKKNRMKDELWAIVIMAFGVFFAVSMHTRATGEVGVIIKNIFTGCFGFAAFVLPYFLIVFGFLLLIRFTANINKRTVFLLILAFLMISVMNSERFIEPEKIKFSHIDFPAWISTGIKLESGGAVGMFLALITMVAFGKAGLYIFASVVIIICMILIMNTPISQFFDDFRVKRAVKKKIQAEAMEEEARLLAARHKEIEENMKRESQAAENIQNQQLSMNLSAGGVTPSAGTAAPAAPGAASISAAQEYIKKAKDNEKKRNILSLMKDKKLFDHKKAEENPLENAAESASPSYNPEEAASANLENSEPEVKYGLEEIRTAKQGFGLGSERNGEIPAVTQGAEGGATGTSGDDELKIGSFKIDVFDGGVATAATTAAATTTAAVTASTASNAVNLMSPTSIPGSATGSQKVNQVVGQPTAALQEKMKMTKKEAAEAQLDMKDFNTATVDANTYEFPPIELLNQNTSVRNEGEITRSLEAKAAKLEKTLKDFKVDARVVKVTQGPAVTRYEIQPNAGVKVSSIVRLQDDIALNLEAKSIRTEAPIPGKAAVGIEVENDKINMVTLREIVDSSEFRQSQSKITFAVGKDIAGKAIVADLKSMPHMLIAGSTGSGKSVCINSIIVSILYKAKPDEVKFVLIDPKVVELGNYNGIPHMLIPVVTDPNKAAAALNWAVAEMTDRYKKFADEGVRDLAGYNDLMMTREEKDKVLPQIVIIIDELADLMMAAPSQVEESICRLAQMARAAGMHLIVATQRPSVDIITGVIKANIPSRIAFAVSSQFDSRTILDMAGAEKLVGKGDMLFNPLGSGKPVRVQGNFVSDSEVHNVIEFLKQQSIEQDKSYSEIVMDTIENADVPRSIEENDGDELLSDAIETVVRAEQASVSMLQRRFRIGYNRAARIIDMMEARGIIGPADGSRPRQVLMSLDEFLSAKNEGMQVTQNPDQEENDEDLH